jgi:hypothetical protein
MPDFRLSIVRGALVAVGAVALAGCSMMGGSDSGSSSSGPLTPQPTMMSASQIQSTLQGKSWRFVGPNNTGTTLYAADGTSLVEVDGKGKTKGHWKTQDGQLCESFDPAPFLPGGVPMSCYPFSGSNGVFKAGKATFTLAG